jgi:hypothetical protein
MAFDLMRRLFKVVQDEPEAIGLQFIQELIPVTVLASDGTHVWVKVPIDAILSYAVVEDKHDGEDQ